MPGVAALREYFDVVTGPHTLNEHFSFAGSDAERIADLQEALDDPDCNLILCMRGGYGLIRLLNRLNMRRFAAHPKWLAGFSDITNLHALLQMHGFCSIHSAMPGFFLTDGQPNPSFYSLIKMLTGDMSAAELHPPHNAANRFGAAIGRLVGGNLSIIYSLLATPYSIDTAGNILFIEDTAEHLYHIDRMMNALKLAGKLDNPAAIVVGGFTELKDSPSEFGYALEEIVRNVVDDRKYPVCFDVPAGHISLNMPLMLGANYELTVRPADITLKPSL
jgi:muramoyltetrapeptide carboxypeptidase